MSKPTVRVVIPCYNYGRFVREAVESALAQEDASVEVVIVNDGSDDGTTPADCDACRELGAIVIHQENKGLPAARNVGAAGAQTDYLLFLDADDTIEPSFVRKLHDAIVADGRDDVSHAYCQERFTGIHNGTWLVPDWDPLLLLLTNLHPVTALVKRSCCQAVGGFDESMRDGYEDWELWLRFVERGWRGVRVREPLFNWRRHSAVTMITEANQRHERLYAALVRAHPDLYRRHADELLIRANIMLFEGGANWVDENHEPIIMRDTLKHLEEVRAEVDPLRAEAHNARAEALQARHELAGARHEAAHYKALCDAYERKPVVRLSRAAFRIVDSLPAPLAFPFRAAARAARAILPQPRAAKRSSRQRARQAAPAAPDTSAAPVSGLQQRA